MVFQIWLFLGGTYALKYSAQSTKDSLHFGTVVAFIGIRLVFIVYFMRLCITLFQLQKLLLKYSADYDG